MHFSTLFSSHNMHMYDNCMPHNSYVLYRLQQSLSHFLGKMSRTESVTSSHLNPGQLATNFQNMCKSNFVQHHV